VKANAFDSKLLDDARQARNFAYDRYSNFPVGAAVLTRSGQVFQGSNVENASYGLTICAERVAIFKAVTAGHRDLVKLAVSCAPGHPHDPAELMPCGACRQVLAEFASDEFVILVDGVGEFLLRDIFPRPFRLSRAQDDRR
jgi:cytidine deaminase